MPLIRTLVLPTIVLSLLASPKLSAQDTEKKPATLETEYEGTAYKFESQAELDSFNTAREKSLYHRIGGKASVSAAVDLFYQKILADKSVNHFFEDVNMKRQHNKQKDFIAAALGSPVVWTGKDMRTAHADLDITEKDFNTVAGHLKATLEELGLGAEIVGEIMAVVGTTRDAVLGKGAKR